MTEKNKKLRKASWIGMRMDFWNLINRFGKWLTSKSSTRISKLSTKQDTLLNEITDGGMPRLVIE